VLNAPKGTLIGFLEDIKAGQLQGLVVQLVKTDLTDAEMLVAATVKDVANKANFGGYANKTAINFGGVTLDVEDRPSTLTPLLQWAATDGTTPNTIYGYAVLDTATNNVIMAEKFATPIPIAEAYDAIDLVIRFFYPSPTSSLALTA